MSAISLPCIYIFLVECGGILLTRDGKSARTVVGENAVTKCFHIIASLKLKLDRSELGESVGYVLYKTVAESV